MIIIIVSLLSVAFLCGVGIYQYVELTEIKLNNKEL